MRLLAWNMASGGPGGSNAAHERAWEYLRDEEHFDIALLQETRRPPQWADDLWRSVIWKPKYANAAVHRPLWGCAVVSASLELFAYEPDDRFPWLAELAGSTAIAKSPSDPRWLASVHLRAAAIPPAVVDRHSIEGIEITTPDQSVWETHVIPHELHRLFRRDTFVWGGDFNADPRMDCRRGFVGGNRRMFETYAAAGSCDTRERFHADYVQTYFKRRTGAYQLDHVFADAMTEAHVRSWQVDERVAISDEPRSDHAPIIVELKPA